MAASSFSRPPWSDVPVSSFGQFMTRRVSFTMFLLASTAPLPAWAREAAGEAVAAQPGEENGDDHGSDEIVVQGQRPPGSVVGDIPPENVLNPRDIRATGATSIDELLESVASQTGSARGRSNVRRLAISPVCSVPAAGRSGSASAHCSFP